MDDRNIILIGFMGAGKTSIGEQLAYFKSQKLIDTDRMVERKAGMTISEIFERSGEAEFRRLETEVLKELLAQSGGEIISVGGGLPLRVENRQLLKKLGVVIYLKVRPETVLERLEGDSTRPLLLGEHREETVKDLLAHRDPIYESAAHLAIPVDGRTVEQIADEILKAMDMEYPFHVVAVEGKERGYYEAAGD